MIGVILQSRMSSTRLPGKATLSLKDVSVTAHCLRALRCVDADLYILATDEDSAAVLGPIAHAEGFHLHIGDRDDVLTRYCSAIRRYGVSTVIRATGDNPLVSAEAANFVLLRQQLDPLDYRGLTGLPVGTGVEVVRAAALLKAELEAVSTGDREHVCPYLYNNPGIFGVCLEDAPEQWRFPEARVTLDTYDDYCFLKEVFQDLYDGHPIPVARLVTWLKKRAPEAVDRT
jgi:spore coat polysaccharide biosynthesis protein SpsF